MKLQRPDPGIDVAKSGLHGKAGIFFNAGLFSKGGGFNPLDLDPYLLFDAQTSMIGTLENPTLDLDPATPSTLDVITATRGEGLQLDGVNDYVDLNQSLVPASGNFEISIQYTHTEQSATNRYLLSQGSSVSTFFGISINNDNVLAYTQGTNPGAFATTSISRGATYNFKITRVGDVFTLFINGSSAGTQTQTGLSVSTNTNTFIGQSTWASDRFVKGVVSNVSKDGVTYYQGNGNTAADWIDLVGSNDATLNGSPSVFAPATLTAANGNVVSALPNTARVDQTQGAELTPTKFQNIGYTDFSSGWTTLLGMTVASAGTFEGQPVYRLTTNGAANNIFKTSTPTLDGVTYIASFYIRRISGSSTLTFRSLGSASGSGITLPIIPTEWTRLTVSYLGKSGGGDVEFGFWQLGTGNDVYEIAMPQLEEGTTASSFVANTTGSPKFITGATFGPRVPMILVEPSATNLLTYSEDFSNSAWAKQYSVGVTSSSVDAPDGTTNAFKITGLESTYGDVGLSDVVAASASTTYTFSVYLKASNSDDVGKKVRLRIRRDVGSWVATEEQVSLSSEWTRHTATITLLSGSTGAVIMITKDLSSSTSERADGCLIWGAQVEEGSVATSYIPALSGSTVTRAADDLSILGSQFTNFFNTGGDGTFYAEYQFNDADGANSLIYGSADNQRFAYKNAGSASPLLSYDGTNVLSYGRLTAGTLLRTALSFDSNSMEGSQDGSAATMSGQTAPFPHNGNFRSATELSIGSDTSGGKQLNGHIKRLIYWPYHSDSL